MRIYEYDEVDPLEVLHVNMLCLDFALTPELVAQMRRLDPRPFSFLGLYAKEEGRVAGQVGVFRLPVVSLEGAQEVGGIWAVATHPAFAQHGIASRLLEEAHTRMRNAGLRFSTVGTQRNPVAYSTYLKLGYEAVMCASSVIAARSTLQGQNTPKALRAQSKQLALADRLFEIVAANSLGFVRRHLPFFPSLAEQDFFKTQTLWLLWQQDEAVGYAVGSHSKSVLRIDNLTLLPQVDPVAAVAALVGEVGANYVWVRVDRASDATAFLQAGFRVAQQDGNVLMVKPLTAGATVEQFRTLYGVTSDRFLMSFLDVT